jgi:rifampin ADP-ribosylating transferase
MNIPANDAPTGLYYHGTRADLSVGDLIAPGFASNFGQRRKANWVYFTATLDAAIWGAELAQGEARERIYIVEPMGAWFDDPNLTDRKYPGNPTRSFRSQSPLRVTGEVAQWQGHDPERLQQMKDAVQRAKEAGVEAED